MRGLGAYLRRRPAVLLLAAAVLLLVAAFLTRPPATPSYAEARAAWRPSEAWLRYLEDQGVRCIYPKD